MILTRFYVYFLIGAMPCVALVLLRGKTISKTFKNYKKKQNFAPVVPHKAVAEVSKIGNL